jgi:hypothetical protein
VLSSSEILGSSDFATGFARFFFAWLTPLCSVLTKGTSADVQITIRQAAFAGPGARSAAIPLELFSTNKEMGRILIRRGGETIAAGEYPSQSCDLPVETDWCPRYCIGDYSLKITRTRRTVSRVCEGPFDLLQQYRVQRCGQNTRVFVSVTESKEKVRLLYVIDPTRAMRTHRVPSFLHTVCTAATRKLKRGSARHVVQLKCHDSG